MSENDQTKAEPKIAAKFARALRSPVMVLLLVASLALLIFVFREGLSAGKMFGEIRHKERRAKFEPAEEGAWRFIVSGDSRNCGDVVMPAIAADSVPRYQPSFYWHLGDLRAIYKIDEDMAFAELKAGRYLGCENYVKRAWPDFIENQIAPFGGTPFYLGIGNHEVIPPKNKPSGQFTSQFADWLLAPAIKAQRLQDKDCDNPPLTGPAKTAKQGAPAAPECLVLPRNYYHWIQGGVDFIYLDNAANVFGAEQIKWLQTTLDNARKNESVRSVVVGMHEALPDSISADHAMCDEGKKNDHEYDQSCKEGRAVYQGLLKFQDVPPLKRVYVLASHSHFYMDGIFNAQPDAKRLHGWIVGTAGAVLYPLPDSKDSAKPNDARRNVYGYLLGTVKQSGEIEFKFQEVKQEDVPHPVSRRYPRTFVDWCFAHNSEDIDPNPAETTSKCLAPRADPTPSPSPKK